MQALFFLTLLIVAALSENIPDARPAWIQQVQALLGTVQITPVSAAADECLTRDQVNELNDSLEVIRASLAVVDAFLDLAADLDPDKRADIMETKDFIDAIDNKLLTHIEDLTRSHCPTCKALHDDIDKAIDDIIASMDREDPAWRDEFQYDAVAEMIDTLRNTVKLICPGWEPTVVECFNTQQNHALEDSLTVMKSSLDMMDKVLAAAATLNSKDTVQQEKIVAVRSMIDNIDNKLIHEVEDLMLTNCVTCTAIDVYMENALEDMYDVLHSITPGCCKDNYFKAVSDVIDITTSMQDLVCPK